LEILVVEGLRCNRNLRELLRLEESNHIEDVSGARTLARALQENDYREGVSFIEIRSPMMGGMLCAMSSSRTILQCGEIRNTDNDIQREIDVYLDMNGAGRKLVFQTAFPSTCWTHFLVQ
jgi:hypothetical protein